MNPEEAPLLKPTLRMAAMMLVPTMLFLGVLSVAALAIAPSAPKSADTSAQGASDSKQTAAPPEGDKTRARAAKTPGKI